MVILHYIPSLQKSMGQTAQFAQMLRDVMGKTIETYIISGSVSRREFVRRLSEVHPDVVHLHGCWSLRIALAERWCINRGYPVILSPHGGLSPKIVQKDFWKKRLPQILLYQFRTIKKAYVLHAATPQELKDLKELGWKKRIALIAYPNNDEEKQILRDSFHDLYQKIIDTTTRNELHVREREALWTMLNAAISDSHEPAMLTEDESKHLSQLTSHNWQRLQVYALDHRIKDIMMRGAEALGITVPVNVQTVPPRYTFKPAFHTGTPTSIEQKAKKQNADHPTELTIATEIYILKRSVYNNELRDGYDSPLSMLCHIAEQIRWTDYEEDIMLQIADKLGIRSFAARLMQILSETMHLTIGFMPLDPIDDRTTETIRKKLNNLI